MNKFHFILPILASFSFFGISLVSACGGGHEEEASSGGLVSFGFMNGAISSLLAIALIFSIILLIQNITKNTNNIKGGNKK